MKNKFILLTFSLVSLFILVNSFEVFALQEPEQKENTPTKPNFITLAKIKEAQELLKRSAPLRFVEKTTKVPLKNKKFVFKSERTKREIELAIVDLKTGEILTKRYWLDEADIKKAKTITSLYLEDTENLPRFISEDPTEDFQVITNWWNSFNSDLSIVRLSQPEEKDRYAVLANKFMLSNDSFAYYSERTGEKYSDMVYSPYSPVLHLPEFIAEGKTFIGNNTELAFEKLEKLGVESKAFSEQLVTDTVTQNFLKRVFIVEQTDPRKASIAEDGGRRLAERVLVLLGINKEKAFRYTLSKTGASGLGQIMPRTYAGIVKAYPKANLTKDIDIGRIDFLNATMTSVLVFDDKMATVFRNMNSSQRAKLEKKLQTEPDFINEIRAAAYNGGATKYRPLTATISLKVRETVDFVKKYKMIRELKLFTP